MSITIQHQLDLETEDCCNCHVTFAMPASLRRQRLTDGGIFYCPNGHSQHYTKSKVKLLQEQLEEAERKMRAAKCEAFNAKAQAELALNKLNRQTKRVHAGVCPCCNRTFTNLARHMASKHPKPTR